MYLERADDQNKWEQWKKQEQACAGNSVQQWPCPDAKLGRAPSPDQGLRGFCWVVDTIHHELRSHRHVAGQWHTQLHHPFKAVQGC